MASMATGATSRKAGLGATRATKNLFSGPNCDTAILPAGCIGQAHEKGSESPRRGPSRGCAGTGDAHLDALGHRPSDELAQAPEDVGCQVAQLRGPRRVLGGNDKRSPAQSYGLRARTDP